MAGTASVLGEGALAILGRIPAASNVSFLCDAQLDGRRQRCIYKPVRGERPLWDFPDGTLAGREHASYLIDRALGIGAIPVTVLRDGPHGPGMVQEWIETTEETDDLVGVFPAAAIEPGYLPVLRAWSDDEPPEELVIAHRDEPRLREIALLDVVLNNTDRKGGHVIAGPGGRIHAIDHGICLHADDKLRTVLWGWAGAPLTADEHDRLGALLAALDKNLSEALAEHLPPAELAALRDRTARLRESGMLPVPVSPNPIPWPLW
ncbi:SCO1664 family protein [Hoyosella sp. G463]|uniref:SCO1664 family protein n=1 Tax=Lolliginicoccus lacisalsi TaxID=2742202 RepID=A0A927PJS0_9ACTN|nr:SCO1664 family protein [Lolliginicoccus lacisalsi]MBD8505190.1 SCO1664 family protein [Lolliginicoccus lacisalsi]